VRRPEALTGTFSRSPREVVDDGSSAVLSWVSTPQEGARVSSYVASLSLLEFAILTVQNAEVSDSLMAHSASETFRLRGHRGHLIKSAG
jgi:hypothetical protein